MYESEFYNLNIVQVLYDIIFYRSGLSTERTGISAFAESHRVAAQANLSPVLEGED